MLHQWFVGFGGYAILFAVLSFFVARFLSRNPSSQSDDKQAAAFGTIVCAILAGVFLFIGLVCSLIGISGSIPGWIGFAFGGAFFALLSRAD